MFDWVLNTPLYRNYLKITEKCFEDLFQLVEEDITKQSTMRHDNIIPVKMKLTPVLLYPISC